MAAELSAVFLIDPRSSSCGSANFWGNAGVTLEAFSRLLGAEPKIKY
jgi:hypothetical protein